MSAREYSDAERASLSARGTKGIYTAHANRSPEQRSELARKAAQARWDRERAEHPERERKQRTELLSADELQQWLDEVDRRYPGRRWASHEARRREALLLARKSVAEATIEALREAGGKRG